MPEPTTQVRKAVIPAAGLGTRFLPATKAQPKEMLALVDTPAIQYVVEEAVSAGLRDVLIITGRGKRSIEDHFDRSFELEHYLESSAKLEELTQVRKISQMADIHYVRQGDPRGLGHAVLTGKPHIGAEPFVVLLGDDIMDPRQGVVRRMIDTYHETGSSVVALKEVDPAEISQYGCARVELADDGNFDIVEIVEKPDPGVAPSNLAVMGRYLFTPDIFGHLEGIGPGAGGEIQLTDAIGQMIRASRVVGFRFEKGRFDIGNKLDYLKATVELALERDDLGDEFRVFLRNLVDQGKI